MTLPETNNLIAELEAGWLTISLNVPKNRNALFDGEEAVKYGIANFVTDNFTDVARQTFLTALQSDGGREGLAASMQKRKPNWADKT